MSSNNLDRILLEGEQVGSVDLDVYIDSDRHSGLIEIALDEEYTIRQNKQMTTHNKLTINGRLKIDGDLILQ